MRNLVIASLLLAVICAHGDILEQELYTHRYSSNGKSKQATLAARQPGLCDKKVRSFAGYFSIRGGKTRYFYWFFERKSNPQKAPLILWLNGGPGCSSMFGLFIENGPCHIYSKGSKRGRRTYENKYSWSKHANIMYVDQPAGTGFSVGQTATNEKGVAEDMYQFLQAFFKSPTFQGYKTKFYVFGESYGGHFVPAISHRIFVGNQKKQGVNIPLAGVGIGNGLVSPLIQYKYYAKMGYKSGSAPARFSYSLYTSMMKTLPTCLNLIKACYKGNNQACLSGWSYCNAQQISPLRKIGFNPYDLRRRCGPYPLCDDFSFMTKYLNTKRVQRRIGANLKWSVCNFMINYGFRFDWMHTFDIKLPLLLNHGIPVVAYYGDQDFICNWLGGNAWTNELKWNHGKQFRATKFKKWYGNDGKHRGNIRKFKDLSFVRVFKAGHMVPGDQPVSADSLIEQFLTDTLGDVGKGGKQKHEEFRVPKQVSPNTGGNTDDDAGLTTSTTDDNAAPATASTGFYEVPRGYDDERTTEDDGALTLNLGVPEMGNDDDDDDDSELDQDDSVDVQEERDDENLMSLSLEQDSAFASAFADELSLPEQQ